MCLEVCKLNELTKNNSYPENCYDMNVTRYKEYGGTYVGVRRENGGLAIKSFGKDEKEEAYAWAFKDYYANQSLDSSEWSLIDKSEKLIDESDNKSYIKDDYIKLPNLKLKNLFDNMNKPNKKDTNTSSAKSSSKYDAKGRRRWSVQTE